MVSLKKCTDLNFGVCLAMHRMHASYILCSTKRKHTLGLCVIMCEMNFSNSLIIHAAPTQPEHHILVRWMGLETQ